MRWTPQMEQGLREISASTECPTDKAFALQIRLQLIGQKAIHVREQRAAATQGDTGTTPPPDFLYLKALQSQLQDLLETLPPALKTHGKAELRAPRVPNPPSTADSWASGPHPADITLLHAHYIELSLSETAHTANSTAPLLGTPQSGHSTAPSFERLECLWRSLHAVKAYMDVFDRLPPSACQGFSFVSWAQMGRCFVVLYRLSTLADPAWDRAAVRATIDLGAVLGRVAAKLEQAGREAGERDGDGLFARMSGMISRFPAWVGDKVAAGKEAEGEEGAEENQQQQQPQPWIVGGSGDFVADQDQYQAMMTQPIDFGDDKWLEEFLSVCR